MKNLFNLICRGVVTASNAVGKLQTLQVSLLAGERKDRLEHFEPYGFTSNPPDGAECLTLFLDGDRSHGIIPVVTDRRVRIRNLPKGAVGIGFDETPAIVVNPDGTVTIIAKTLTIQADTIHSEGAWAHDGDITADGISLKTHQHSDPQGGNTGTPL